MAHFVSRGGPAGLTVRRALNALYDGAAWLAALFMIALLVTVLLSIAGRELHFHVKGTDAYAGYCMAAAGFLALAHTLKRGEHIRVTLLLTALSAGARRARKMGHLTITGADAATARAVALQAAALLGLPPF